MKGTICYYSGAGNTRLACKYIAGKIEVPFDLVDVVKEKEIALKSYDVVGFATFTDFLGPPHLFQAFIGGLPHHEGKLAFVFNTYGSASGKTLSMLRKNAAARGFDVIGGHSLHTSESYPPMIARGKGAAEAPSEENLRRFDAFICGLGDLLRRAERGQSVERKRMRIGWLNSILPALPRTHARRDMGGKSVDESLCVECGTCERRCPYSAIRLDPKPVFDLGKCYGCWRCYNSCPKRAIRTKKFRGEPYYPRPNDQLREKLEV